MKRMKKDSFEIPAMECSELKKKQNTYIEEEEVK